MARLYRLARIYTAALLALGLILRLAVLDVVDPLAVFYYATPWPVLAVLGFIAASLWMEKRRLALACLAAGVFSAVMWVTESYERNPQSNEPQDLRVVSWNAEHSKDALPQIIEHARGFDADILGITETESTHAEDAVRWRSAFPGHTVATLPGYMLFITRGEITGTLSGSLARRGRFNLVRVKFGERPAQVLVVEFDANPLRSRRPPFVELQRTIANLPNEPIILMGDFNTPRESIYYGRSLNDLQNAFDIGGEGFAETWPVPLPLLSLDHIFVSKTLRVLRCRHGSSLSDHRPVIADLAWPSAGDEDPPPASPRAD